MRRNLDRKYVTFIKTLLDYYDNIDDISGSNCCCDYKYDCGGTRIDSTDWTHDQTYPLDGYCDNCAYYDSHAAGAYDCAE